MKEYNLKKLKKRPGPVKVVADAAKIAISIRLDSGELVDRTSPDLKKLLKNVV
ncbi:MAG: hypothetical protein J0L82_00825 [Deltaproteobacteria bacterium]|nr:hypothetical protein [Deltaproteobacteria bacterium]